VTSLVDFPHNAPFGEYTITVQNHSTVYALVPDTLIDSVNTDPNGDGVPTQTATVGNDGPQVIDQGFVLNPGTGTFPFVMCEGTNANDLCQGGEPAVAGAQVYLGDPDDPNTHVLTTGPNGEVLFDNLTTGPIDIVVVLPMD
jgi:hypothetical protein